ncbi:hypothetical protein BGP75_11110 [Motiliproteus sp. MSK22-1]|nr:hypothetical protein BGP75_11110 [Motiliproteus sp. MSK22-1]
MEKPLQETEVLMARQPIFDRQLSVVAYELLYRSGSSGGAAFLDGDEATSDVILNAYTGAGADVLARNLPVFVNFTHRILVEHRIPKLLRSRVVIEVLEDTEIDTPLIVALSRLKTEGFRLALDDFVFQDKYLPLLDIVDIIKLDVLQLSSEELVENIKLLQPYSVSLLAEKVESQDKLFECMDLGCKLFQGYFLQKPTLVAGKKVGSDVAAVLQLIAELNNPEITPAEVETLIVRDSTLTYKILRILNSAEFTLVKKIVSIREAVCLLGQDQLLKWASLIALCSNSEKPPELTLQLLARGRMCELLAESIEVTNANSYFLVGLLSGIHAVLDIEKEQLLELLSLGQEVKQAISSMEGEMGLTLKSVLAYEQGEWDALSEIQSNVDAFPRAYQESISWAQDALKSLDRC